MKTKTHTFAIIKPTAVKRRQIGEIISDIENNGFVIEQMKTIDMTQEQAETLYAEHAGRDFFPDLCAYMRSGPIVVMDLSFEWVDCWKYWRTVIGATDPSEAEDNTIRRKFGISRRENAVHGSDSEESAQRELGIFFKN